MRFLIALLPLFVVGCTPMQWTKAGQDPAEMRKDISACDRQAWMRAQSDDFFNSNHVMAPMVHRDQQGRPYITWAQRHFPDRSVREMSLFEMCMRDRGYQYVPVRGQPRAIFWQPSGAGDARVSG